MTTTPTQRRAVVIVVDGWGAGFWGPYGNAWLDTPAGNRLAAGGMLVEQALVDSPTIDAFYQGVWAGQHAALPGHRDAVPLAELLQQRHHSSCLITDVAAVAEHCRGQAFGQAEVVQAAECDALATSPDQTQLGRLMAAALATLERDAADLVWVHADGMNAAWDAPREYREQFRDADDPPVPLHVRPPAGRVPLEIDPDVVQGWIWAYAGQVVLWDHCLEALLESWREIDAPTLLIVMGARGYALAEHGCWGHLPTALYSEHLHVPLVISSNACDLANIRCQQLVQPYDVYQTLLDWFDLDSGSRQRSLLGLAGRDLLPEGSGWPPLAIARWHDCWALRTPAWHACLTRQHQVGPSQAAEGHANPPRDDCRLFLKPDDRWEVNDVADRCPDVVAEFRTLCERLGELPADAGLDAVLPLSDLLLSPPE